MSLLFRFHFYKKKMCTFLLSIFPSFLQDKTYTASPSTLFTHYISRYSTTLDKDCSLFLSAAVPSCIVWMQIHAASMRAWTVINSVCPLCVGHGSSGYICCLATLCQALGVKARPTLASGSPARDLYNKEPSLSPRGRLDSLKTRGTCYQEETSHTE